MSRTVQAHQGDSLDRLCHRHFGYTAGVTEQVLELNPGLAELGPVLPQGTRVQLPDAAPTETRRNDTLQLWS